MDEKNQLTDFYEQNEHILGLFNNIWRLHDKQRQINYHIEELAIKIKPEIEKLINGNINNPDAIQPILTWFYWHGPQGSPEWVRSILKNNGVRLVTNNWVKESDFSKYVKPLEFRLLCCKCGKWSDQINRVNTVSERNKTSFTYYCNKCSKIKNEKEARKKEAREYQKKIEDEKYKRKEEWRRERKRKKVEALKNMPYKEYLKSEHWAYKRQRALDHYGHKCAVCGSQENLNVHHNTYKNRGEENMRDLTVLCRMHHEIIHQHPNSYLEDQ